MATEVIIEHRDGSRTERYGYALLEKFKGLKRRGLKGKALIDEMFSDDWAAPPMRMTIKDQNSIVADVKYE